MKEIFFELAEARTKFLSLAVLGSFDVNYFMLSKIANSK